jgi:hypothetical protein
MEIIFLLPNIDPISLSEKMKEKKNQNIANDSV